MNGLEIENLAHEEVSPLMGGTLMNGGVSEDTDAETLLTMFSLLDYAEKRIEKRKEVIRKHLLHIANENGVKTEKGGKVLILDDEGTPRILRGSSITAEIRRSALPDEGAIEKMLLSKSIPLTKAFTTKRVRVLDPSRLKALVEVGALSAKAVAAAHSENEALKCRPSTELKSLCESTSETLQELTEKVEYLKSVTSSAKKSRKKVAK